MRPAILRLLPALVLTTGVAPAHAAKVTLGSDLKRPATITESHGADTAFWATSVNGKPIVIPEDAQVLSVRVRGSAMREPGAGDPATMVHFQSLQPAAADGSRQVWLTSQAFYMPVDRPDAVTTFRPENLCVHRGGGVSFNDIGGFHWGGSLTAPLDYSHYGNGAPFRVFAAARRSATDRYTADNGTNNGMILHPLTANQDAAAPYGATMKGTELLMQVVIATGRDRSEPCGGPRRHPDGSLVVIPPEMHVITPQRAYVTHDRRFAPAIFCAGPKPCTGTAKLTLGGHTIGESPFSAAPVTSARIPMRLTPAEYGAMDATPFQSEWVRLTLHSPFGTFSSRIKIGH